MTHEILTYLMDHPDAEDTLEGITEWWVLEACLKIQAAKVQRALDELVSSGLVTKKVTEHTGARYRLSPGKLAEVREKVFQQDKSIHKDSGTWDGTRDE